MSKVFNKIIGDSAEGLARNYLKNNGYKVIKCNYKNKLGEIDIIANEGKTLVFIEVKYRKDNSFGLPREAVDSCKQMKIRNVASVFINQNRLFDKSVRFDVLEILGDKITLIKNCF